MWSSVNVVVEYPANHPSKLAVAKGHWEADAIYACHQIHSVRLQDAIILLLKDSESFSLNVVVTGEFNIITRREFVTDRWWKTHCPGFVVKQVGETVFGVFGEFIVVADSRVCRDAVSLFDVDCLPHTLSTPHGMCLRPYRVIR
jgi:hypothetical protein